ncbi:MAG: hypothetical protein ACTSQ7_07085 [Alphaproteobacteria bacterium]
MHRSIANLFRISVPLILAALLAAVPARAQEEKAEVVITKADCARLVEHVPAPDVAYQPGVDAYGRKVAPAELDGGTPIQPPETLHIPIEIDLLDRFGIPANPALYKSDIPIGEVVYRNGRLTFEGQPLQDEATAELSRRCQKIMYGKPG